MRTYSIDDLLELVVARGASDLHLTVGSNPAVRVDGQILRLEEIEPLRPDDTQQLMYQILSSEQQKNFEVKRQLDFAYGVPGLARFRVNVYFQRGSVGAAFRLIPEAIKTLEELGLPTSLHELAQKPRGLVLVAEMRDLETIATALTAAETGHLVLGTLHTQSASSTVDRIIDVFPPAQQEQVRMQLAGSLQGIVTQALLPTLAGDGRVAALEILLPDDATRNLIRQGKVEQIYTVMQTGTQKGMQTMEQSLAELALRRVITLETALSRSSRPDQLLGLLERADFDTRAA